MPDAQIYVQDYIKPEKVRPHSSTRRHHVAPPKIASAVPLGLSTFAMAMMVSALYNLNAFGIQQQNVLVGLGLFTGGLVQFISGMWEFKNGNIFGATGFTAYGGFWFSYAVIYIPAFGILDAFKDSNGKFDDAQFHNAMGVYLSAWFIFTVIFTLASIRTNIGVLSAFICLSVTMGCEVIYNFVPSFTAAIKIAGVTGMMCSMIVWYCLGATILIPELSPISLPLWDLSHKD